MPQGVRTSAFVFGLWLFVAVPTTAQWIFQRNDTWLQEELVDVVCLSADDDHAYASPLALHLLQRAAARALAQEANHRPIAAASLAETQPRKQTQPAASRQRSSWRQPTGCLTHHGEALVRARRSLPPVAHAELAAMRHLGLLAVKCDSEPPGLGPAQLPMAADLGPSQFHPVVERSGHLVDSRLVVSLCVAWAVLCVVLVGYALVAVIVLPSLSEEDGRLQQKKNPLGDELQAWGRGYLPWLSLTWLDSLVGRCSQRSHAAPLDPNELVLQHSPGACEVGARLLEAWREEVATKGLSSAQAVRAVRRALGLGPLLRIAVLAWLATFLELVGMALALDLVLAELESSLLARVEEDMLSQPALVLKGLGLVFGLPLLHRLVNVALGLLDGYHTSQLATAFGRLVFEKALRLPVGCSYAVPLHGEPQGVVQLLSTDVAQEWACTLRSLGTLSAAPFVFLTLLVLLVSHLRLAGLLGALYLVPGLVLSLPILQGSLQRWRQYRACQHERVARTGEFLRSVRVVRALAWEAFAVKRLGEVRQRELDYSSACTVSTGLFIANLHCITWFVALGGLFIHVLTKGTVDSRHAWVAFQVVASLRACLNLMVLGLQRAVAIPSSLRRVEAFLQLPESPAEVLRGHLPSRGAQRELQARLSGSFAFEEGGPPVLHDLDLQLVEGELVAVVGASASGKSALLLALLGELFPVDLAVAALPRLAAYCSEEPWILDGSLMENVTLGQRLEPGRYHAALQAAALLADLAVLPAADQTLLGSQGAILSASQRARVALARAAYQGPGRPVLLDDPLGQLPEAMSRHIMQHLLMGPELQSSARLVIMRPDSRLLGYFDRVLILEDGHVVQDGPPNHVLRSISYLALLGEAEAPPQFAWQKGELGTQPQPCWTCTAPPVPVRELVRSVPQPEAEGHERCSLATLLGWVRAGGTLRLALAVQLGVLQRCAQLLESLGLAMWGDAALRADCDHRHFASVLLAMVLLNSALIWASEWACSRFSSAAGAALHDRTVQSLLRAPIDRFFDKQPVGRLLSRLSTDLAQVDTSLAGFALGALRGAAGGVLQQAYIFAVAPAWLVAGSVPVVVCVFIFCHLYRGTAVSLVCCARSSLVFLHDLSGLPASAIAAARASKSSGLLQQRHCAALDAVIRVNYIYLTALRAWVSLRMTLCVSCALTAVTLYALLNPGSSMGVGTLGLIISLAFALLVDLESFADHYARCTLAMGALQRVTDLLAAPQEAEPRAEIGEGPRLVVVCPHKDLVPLALMPGNGPSDLVLISSRDGQPLLQASCAGQALRLVEGRGLSDLVQGAVDLPKGAAAGLQLVAAGPARHGAVALSRELLQPLGVTSLRLEFWRGCAESGGLRLQVQGLCAGYAGLPDVVRGASFELPALSRTALLGPAGSGKSTVLLSLLRLVEPRRGKVLLGGADLARTDLRALRMAVSLVPEKPAVFAGSWHENLDPLNELPEQRLCQALQRVGLELGPKGLDETLGSGSGTSSHLSASQRQLLGLARAIVRQPPLLLLEEGPLEGSSSSSEVIHKVLASEFPLATVLAVATSTKAAKGFDRVLMLREGEVVEQRNLKGEA